MQNIIVGRYDATEGIVQEDGTIRRDWQGWIEPDDKTWIMFVRYDGSPVVYLDRNPTTGAVRTP